MIDYTDISVWPQRIQGSEDFRDVHMIAYDKMIRAYHGHGYEPHESDPTPENFYYSYVTSTVPGYVERNPLISVSSALSGVEDQMSVPMQHGLNQWVHDVDFAGTLVGVATKFCFTWAVGMVTNEPDISQGNVQDRPLFKNGKLRDSNGKYKPRFYDLDPKLFAVDHRALSINQAEYQFHRWFACIDDLLLEADEEGSTWNREALEGLGQSVGAGRDAADIVDPSREGKTDQGKSDLVGFISIWVPGLETDGMGPDQGYNGSIITLADNPMVTGTGRYSMPRDPEPYFGSSMGPYEVFAPYLVPGKLWPMGALAANFSNIEELNATVRGITKSNNEGKNALLYDSLNTADMERIIDAESGSAIGIEGFDRDAFIAVTFGYASPQQYTAFNMLKSTLQGSSGQNDATQGNVTGIGTATENQIANETTQRKSGFLYDRFSSSAVRCLERVAHYFHWDNDIEFALGNAFFDAEQDIGIEPGARAVFHGGQEGKAELAEYEIKIEMYSMGRTDRVQLANSLLLMDKYLLETVQLRAVAPWVDWQTYDEMHATALGLPALKNLVDNKAAAEQQPWADGGELPKARFSGDAHPSPAGQGAPRVRMNRPQMQDPGMGGQAAAGMPQQISQGVPL